LAGEPLAAKPPVSAPIAGPGGPGKSADADPGSQPGRSAGQGRSAFRCQLPYPDLAAFIADYAVNVSAAGMFIAAREPPAVGTMVGFEMVLADARPILRGEGEVVFATPAAEAGAATAQPAAAPLCGFGVRFVRLSATSRGVLAQVLAYQAAHPERFGSAVPIPYPAWAPGHAEPRRESPAPGPGPGSSPLRVPAPASQPAAAAGPASARARAEEAELQALLRPAAVTAPSASAAARLLDELLARRPVAR
jgi:uncharacterized protein (TIGR02266 family)